jgi:hypothetical protein
MKRESITLHVGSAGIQAGNHHWEQLAYEHGINKDGTKADWFNMSDKGQQMFSEDSNGKYRPLCLNFDLEHNAAKYVFSGPCY